ncbi:MAG: CHASE domain-containing protein [Magnetococcales bacterium]|nr:CHASE domain-containing protein [Magnetococcales bacterium]
MNIPTPPTSWIQNRLIGAGSIWLVAFVGIALSLITFWVTNHQLTVHKKLDFKWAAQNRFRAFQKGAGESLEALGELRTMLIGFPELSRDNFRVSASAILFSHAEIEAFIWIPFDSTNWEQEAFLQRNHGMKEEWDLVQSPNMAGCLEKAVQTGKMTASSRLLSRKNEGKTRFVACLPVYRIDAEPTLAVVRNRNPIGFVMGIYLLEKLVQTSLGPLEPRGIDIKIEDQHIAEQTGVLYQYSSRLRENGDQTVTDIRLQPDLVINETVDIADRSWHFTAQATTLFRSAQAFNEGPWILLTEGVLFTIVLVLYLFRLQIEMRKRLLITQALTESEEKFRSLLDYSPDFIISLDEEGRILFMNRPFPDAKTEVKIGADFLNLLPKSLFKKHTRVLQASMANNTVENIRFSLPDLTWWEARYIPINLKHSDSKTMLIISDVTRDHVLHAQAIRNARLASLGVLAASVAHEINNPNSAIQFNNTILMRTWGDITSVLKRYSDNISQYSLGGMPADEALEAIPRLMNGINNSTQRIKKIVGNLKHMARQDKGGMDQVIHINEVLQDAISILQNQVSKYTDFCHLDPGGELPVIRGNAQQLEQVVINILLNALQSLPDRSRRVQLSAEVDGTRENILIHINDEGEGIPEETLNNISDPFFTTKEHSGGTGLGLSISNDIIRNHGGKIHFDSKVGEGTLVTVCLPIIPSALAGLQT